MSVKKTLQPDTGGQPVIRPVSSRFDASSPAEVARWAAEEVTTILYSPEYVHKGLYRTWNRPISTVHSLSRDLDDDLYALEESTMGGTYADQADMALRVAARAIMIADRATMLHELQQESDEEQP